MSLSESGKGFPNEEFLNQNKTRDASTEDQDSQDATRRGKSEQSRDWPNEAGFQALHEETVPVKLAVEGKFPHYTQGVLYRTGPGSWKVENPGKKDFTCSHWFDGFVHSHRFEITSQTSDKSSIEVMYTSRSQAKPRIEALRQGAEYGMSFGQKRDPCVGVFGKVMSVFKSKIVSRPVDEHNLGVTVLPNYPGFPSKSDEQASSGHNPDIKNVWVGTDNTFMMKMDPVSLKVKGFASQKDLNPELSGPISCAHSQKDHQTGDIYNFNLAFGREAVYKVFRVSAMTGETHILATLSGPGILPAYIHSFFLTDDFVVLAIWSSHFGLNGLKIMWNQSMLDGIDPFDKSKSVKWLVIDRKHGKGLVAEFDSDAAFSFHTVNAWQEPRPDGTSDIICDVICYESLDILHSLYYTNVRSQGEGAITFANEKGDSSRSHFARFKLSGIDSTRSLVRDSKVAAPRAEELFKVKSPHTGDLPTINPRFSTRRSRYVYSLVNRGYSVFIDGISKFDTETRQTIFWDNPFGHTPGEAIFVPNPDGTEEDDGVLLSVILDGIKSTSYLVCLSAKTMEEVGKASVGAAVGLGFHGAFVSG